MLETIWLYSAFLGFAPIAVWLFFWLREDVNQKAPLKLMFKTFVFGIFAVLLSLFFQSIFNDLLAGEYKVLTFAFIEEFLKLLAVFLAALGTVWNNEKRDPMIFMIVGALGFACVENILFVYSYIENEGLLSAIVDGSYRSIGATLLHVASSAIIGFFISRVFFKKLNIRIFVALIGLFFATIIHAAFNFLVMSDNSFYNDLAFYAVWGLIIIILFIFETMRYTEKYRFRHKGVVYYHKKRLSYIDDETGKLKENLSFSYYDNYQNTDEREIFF